MGASLGDFHKYPRTPHVFGSTGTIDDKHLSHSESLDFLNDDSLIIEEKIDGSGVAISFLSDGKVFLQCRGHEIKTGMHPQYDLFKQWANTIGDTLEIVLEDRYVMYGEWMYARHSIRYLSLPHYFFEFDILDKRTQQFLDLKTRENMLLGSGIQTVPIIGYGKQTESSIKRLIRPSVFGARFENKATGKTDDLVEGLYFRTEKDGVVTGRAKYVRPEFVENIKNNEHWQYSEMVINKLTEDADIWR